jgi:hypothetical protein
VVHIGGERIAEQILTGPELGDLIVWDEDLRRFVIDTNSGTVAGSAPPGSDRRLRTPNNAK